MGSVKAGIGAGGSGIFSFLSRVWILQNQERGRDKGKMDALTVTLQVTIITLFGTDGFLDGPSWLCVSNPLLP